MMTAASYEQIEMLLSYMEEHPELAQGRLVKDITGRITANRLWINLTNSLNSMGGSLKSKTQWQKVWTDKKYCAKKAVGKCRKEAEETGEPVDWSSLSTIDQRVLEILGQGVGEPPKKVPKPFKFIGMKDQQQLIEQLEDNSPRIIYETQDTADEEEASSETVSKWSQWKPIALKSRPSLGNLRRPVTVADARNAALQRKMLEEEYESRKRQWDFEEEEREHKRSMWALEKKLLLKTLKE